MRLLTGLLAFRMIAAWVIANGLAWLGHVWHPGFRRLPDLLADEATDPPWRQHWRDKRRHASVECRRWDAGSDLLQENGRAPHRADRICRVAGVASTTSRWSHRGLWRVPTLRILRPHTAQSSASAKTHSVIHHAYGVSTHLTR